MSTSRFTPQRAIPPTFPDVLRNLGREVLRYFPRGAKQPAGFDAEAWILEFCRDYFRRGGKPPAAALSSAAVSAAAAAAAAGAAAGGAGAPGSGGELAAADELGDHMLSLFRSADSDGSGSLDIKELRALLHRVGDDLGLGTADVRLLLSMTDADGDGRVTYAEFVPLALQVITLIKAKQAQADAADATHAAALQGAKYALVHGFTQGELQAKLIDAFRMVDGDRDGLISGSELAAALHGSGLGLSRKDVVLLVAEADMDASGLLSFAEFAPMCFNLLADQIAKQLEIELTPSEQTAIESLLVRDCENYDRDGAGRVHHAAIVAVLRDSDLHLSWLQQQALAANAAPDADGLVDYRAFAARAAPLVRAVLSTSTNVEAAQRLLDARAAPHVNAMDRPAFEAQLAAALPLADPSAPAPGAFRAARLQ